MHSSLETTGTAEAGARRSSRPRWHLLYYLLAAFTVFALALSLYLNRRIVDLYAQAVATHQVWEGRLAASYELDQLAAAVNAPGNDIFTSGAVTDESAKLRAAQQGFNQHLERLRQELQRGAGGAQAVPLLADLWAAQEATARMAGDADQVFVLFREKRLEMAANRMAMMDRKYAKVVAALGDLRRRINDIQQQLLIEQEAAAVSLERAEQVIAVFAGLIVCGIAAYGHTLAKQMAQDARARERYIQDLHAAEAALQQAHDALEMRVEERTQELTIANKTLQAEVVERKQVEAALRGSEARKAAVLETALDGIISMDHEGRIIEFNRAAEQIFGYSRAEAMGQEMAELIIPPTFRDQHRRGLAHYLATGDGPVLEARIEIAAMRRDGSEFPVELAISQVPQAAWPIFTGFIRDLTERKRAEEELVRSEMQLAEAQRIAHIGSWEWDITTNQVRWSDELYRIYGLQPQEFEAAYEAYLACVHPDDRESVVGIVEAARDEKIYVSHDHRVVRPDGAVRVLHCHGKVLIDAAGSPIKMVGTVQDITERRQAEEALREKEGQYRALFENAALGIYRTAPDGRILLVNPTLIRILGYTSFEEMTTCNLETEADADYERAQFKAQIEREGTITGLETAWKKRDGSLIFVRENAQAIRGEDGSIVYYEGTVEDITSYRRLQAQVIQSEKLAALGELVAGVAHEINNPLAAISGTAELLEMSQDAEVCEDARTILRMADRAIRIVRSLLTFARVHDGERRQATARDLVEATLEVCSYKLRKSDITLDLHFAEDMPSVLVNDNQIQQVLLNLLNNAEHALREKAGERQLVISTALENRSGASWATISVADNGCGISEETQGRIFDPFFTTKDIGEGTGLGLSICHGIAEAHGGSLTVESVVETGTTFTLALPIATEPVVEEEDLYARAA